MIRLLAALALAAAIPAGAAGMTPEEGRVQVAAVDFEGPAPLGLNLSTAVKLLIWQTVPAPVAVGPQQRYASSAFVVGASKLPSSRIQQTAIAAKEWKAPLVLTGRVQKFGGEALLNARLLADPGADARLVLNQDWTVAAGGKIATLKPPAVVYNLTPVVLDAATVERLESPTALRVCPEQQPCEGPQLAGSFRLVAHVGDWSRVVSETGSGWVFAPQPAADRTELVDFVGGMAAYYAGNFREAAERFEKVRRAASRNVVLRRDSAVLELCAKARDGQDVSALAGELLAADPGSVELRKAVITTVVAQATLTNDPAYRAAGAREARERLESAETLMEPDDPWLTAMREVVARIAP